MRGLAVPKSDSAAEPATACPVASRFFKPVRTTSMRQDVRKVTPLTSDDKPRIRWLSWLGLTSSRKAGTRGSAPSRILWNERDEYPTNTRGIWTHWRLREA